MPVRKVTYLLRVFWGHCYETAQNGILPLGVHSLTGFWVLDPMAGTGNSQANTTVATLKDLALMRQGRQ